MNNIDILEELKNRLYNMLTDEQKQAIENLIKENRELKEENLELHKEINQRIKLKLENERCADKDFIPKSKVKEDLEICKKVYEEEMKPYQTEYGLNITGLSKKEKEQLINKRNCLTTQMKTYEMLLED